MPFCPNCGAPVNDQDKNCGACGASLQEDQMQPMGYEPPQAPQPPVIENQQYSYEPQTYAPPQPQQDQGQYQAPQYDQNQYQAPQYDQSQYQAPQYDQSQYGQPQYNQPQYNQPQYNGGQPQYQGNQPSNDTGNFGWGVLGCCIPIVGLILFLVWKDSKPKNAKVAGIGALISVGVTIVLWLISFIVGMLGGM